MEDYLNSLRRSGMTIGENVAIYDCILDTNFPHLIEIGSNCIITMATILAHDDSPMPLYRCVAFGRVVIRDNTFVGAGAVILPGVEIGPNAVVGANTVVSRNVPPGAVVAGSPARIVSHTETWIDRLGKTRHGTSWIRTDQAAVVPSEEELSRYIEQASRRIEN